MLTATQFFAYLPAGKPDSSQLTQLQTAFQELGYQTSAATPDQPYLLGYISSTPTSNVVPGASRVLHTTPGAAVKINSDLPSPEDDLDAKKFAFDTVRVFNLIHADNTSVEIVSDPLALLPYYTAQLSRGFLVCSSIRHLLAAAPSLSSEADHQAIFEFLSCGTAFGSRTLHKYVRLNSAGQVIRWDPSHGFRIDRSRRTQVPPADASIAASVAADRIAALIRDSFSHLPSPVLLPLTGGFDSRLIACFAASLKLNPHMVTLGYPRHDEIRVAQAVARTFGGKTAVLPPPHSDVLDLVPTWVDCMEGLADTHTLFMANLLSVPADDGTPLYHGFIGDTLSGGLLNWIPIETASGPDDVAKGVTAYFFGGISSGATDALHLSASVETATDDIRNDLVQDVTPHQMFTLWNLENLQRRRVGNQLLYLGRRFMPVPVFYYPPLMEFWLSMPRIALDDRSLLGYVFRNHFPQIATLPHSERVPNMIPRTIPALQYLSGWMWRRSQLRLLKKFKFNTEKIERRSYIWAQWHGTTPAQKKRELDSLEQTLAILHSRLGWSVPFPADDLLRLTSPAEPKQLLLLRRLFLIGEYAKSVPEPRTTNRDLLSINASSVR